MKVDIARKEIVLDDYNILDKGKILHKHIYYSEISEEFKNEFFLQKQYWYLIQHTNYNPRLIEFVTSQRHIPKGSAKEYWLFVKETFDSPQKVWGHFYQHQLSVEERLLLHAVYLQNTSITAEDIREIFHHLLDFEIRKYNLQPKLSPFNLPYVIC